MPSAGGSFQHFNGVQTVNGDFTSVFVGDCEGCRGPGAPPSVRFLCYFDAVWEFFLVSVSVLRHFEYEVAGHADGSFASKELFPQFSIICDCCDGLCSL